MSSRPCRQARRCTRAAAGREDDLSGLRGAAWAPPPPPPPPAAGGCRWWSPRKARAVDEPAGAQEERAHGRRRPTHLHLPVHLVRRGAVGAEVVVVARAAPLRGPPAQRHRTGRLSAAQQQQQQRWRRRRQQRRRRRQQPGRGRAPRRKRGTGGGARAALSPEAGRAGRAGSRAPAGGPLACAGRFRRRPSTACGCPAARPPGPADGRRGGGPRALLSEGQPSRRQRRRSLPAAPQQATRHRRSPRRCLRAAAARPQRTPGSSHSSNRACQPTPAATAAEGLQPEPSSAGAHLGQLAQHRERQRQQQVLHALAAPRRERLLRQGEGGRRGTHAWRALPLSTRRRVAASCWCGSGGQRAWRAARGPGASAHRSMAVPALPGRHPLPTWNRPGRPSIPSKKALRGRRGEASVGLGAQRAVPRRACSTLAAAAGLASRGGWQAAGPGREGGAGAWPGPAQQGRGGQGRSHDALLLQPVPHAQQLRQRHRLGRQLLPVAAVQQHVLCGGEGGGRAQTAGNTG